MSIDLAWRYSQGQDSILVAVTDSGINWNEGDLLESAYLNPLELETHKPTIVYETGVNPRYYIPALDVRLDRGTEDRRCCRLGHSHILAFPGGPSQQR